MPRCTIKTLSLAALLCGLAGCMISQPIEITYPPGAGWTFMYHDAMGENLGGGKAEVTFSGADRLAVTFTESAFGDRALLEGRLGRATDGWAPFSGRGRWFDGRPFLFVGCIHRGEGRVAPGALALHQGSEASLKAHPLLRDPCAGRHRGRAAAPGFGEAHVDRVFSWSAGVLKKR